MKRPLLGRNFQISARALIRGSAVIDDRKTNQSLRSTRRKAETEGLIIAAH